MKGRFRNIIAGFVALMVILALGGCKSSEQKMMEAMVGSMGTMMQQGFDQIYSSATVNGKPLMGVEIQNSSDPAKCRALVNGQTLQMTQVLPYVKKYAAENPQEFVGVKLRCDDSAHCPQVGKLTDSLQKYCKENKKSYFSISGNVRVMRG